MSHVQNLQHAVMAAKAGNPSLARVHLHKAAEEAPDDPAVWLWMGWLSDSPISMIQCLEAALQDERHHNIAQAGLAFARALSAYKVGATAPASADRHGDHRTASQPVADDSAGKRADKRNVSPVELVEQLAADVARVDASHYETDAAGQFEWATVREPSTAREHLAPHGPTESHGPPAPQSSATEQRSADPLNAQPSPAVPEQPREQAPAPPAATAGGWDPNGQVPPPLPPEASRPPRSETPAAAQAPAQAQAPAASAPSPSVPVSPPPATPQAPPTASRPASNGPAPVWRAASSDWFNVGGSGNNGPATATPSFRGPAAGAPPPVTPQPQPAAPAADGWLDPGNLRSRAPSQATPDMRPSAAAGPPPAAVPPAVNVPQPSVPRQPVEWVEDDAADPFSVGSPAEHFAAPNDQFVEEPPQATIPSPVSEPFPQQTAAEQLDAELERHHVDVPLNPDPVHAPVVPGHAAPAESDATDAQPMQSSGTADVQPTLPAGPWRPTGAGNTSPPLYESPALRPGSAAPYGNAIAPADEARFSGPTFEGEPLKPAAHPRTVLVVDDSPTVRKLVSMTLEKNGYHVVSAYDGVAAIREIAEHNPALILMDVNMPRMDGYQLCKLVRKHEATRHIPVLMLSGKDGVFDRIRGKMVGCSGYVPKPFVPEELVQAVGEHIGVAAR